ncbi:MAG: PD40 domain-containing protein [Armatimonadetes bacterium]|nr:PD40 domain-containing protein [Armatimonadota bacterium]
MPDSEPPVESRDSAKVGRLDSWKEIATYLGREVRTVRRWEKNEGLPVHRHFHGAAATVYAYEAELDGWLKGRGEQKESSSTTADKRRTLALAIVAAAALLASGYFFLIRPALVVPGMGGRSDGVIEGTQDGPRYTVLFADVPVVQFGQWASFDVSPSGDRSVFHEAKDGEPGQLYIHEQTGSVVRALLNDLGPWYGFSYPTWSPDGQLIAYSASKPSPAGESQSPVAAIFVVSPDGGTPRQIGPNLTRVRGLCWTPDGQSLTYLDAGTDGVHTVLLDGGGVRTMTGDTAGLVAFGGYSPDGRWLAMSVSVPSDLPGRHAEIRILSTTDDKTVSLATAPGYDVGPAWGPDGGGLYFVSDANNGPNIWKLTIDPETGSRQGDPVQVTFFSGAGPRHPQAIAGGRRIAFLFSRTDKTIQVADTSRQTESISVAGGGQPRLSPDGQVLYFRKSGPDGAGIYAVTRDGGTPLRLAEDAPFDLSPDGATLAYIRNVGETAALYTVSTRGGEPRVLFEFEGNTRTLAHWSPDGSLLAYAQGTGLFVISADGGTPEKLAELPGWDGRTLRWSPDGELIAAIGRAGRVEGEKNAVFVVPASGGEPRQLTPASVYKEGLEWHPDGQRLTYHMSQGNSETRQVFLDGGAPSLLVNQPTLWDYVGRWAPGGQRFYFKSFEEDSPHDIYVFDEATGDISLFAINADLPTWSRDGKTIAWVSSKESRQLWVMSNFR